MNDAKRELIIELSHKSLEANLRLKNAGMSNTLSGEGEAKQAADYAILKAEAHEATAALDAAIAAPEVQEQPVADEHKAMACKIGDYSAVDSVPMAAVIFDDRKICECYTNEDAKMIAAALQSHAAAPVELPEGSALKILRDALWFYADHSHFILHNEDAWDTVSGEPQNFYEDERNTATVEDGTIAKNALEQVAGYPGMFANLDHDAAALSQPAIKEAPVAFMRPTDQAITDFVEGFDVDTGEGVCVPNEHERFLIDEAIRTAFADPDLFRAAPIAPAVPQDDDLIDIVRTICCTADRMASLTPEQRINYPSPISEGSPLLIAARQACIDRGFTAGGLSAPSPAVGNGETE